MDLAQALVAISATVVGAGIALIGSVYAARANRAAINEGLALQQRATEDSWQREQGAAHKHWVRDQIDLRVGEVLVAVNRFSRAAEAGSFDGAWVEFANAN